MKTQFEIKLFGSKRQFTIGEGHVTRAARKKIGQLKRLPSKKIKKTAAATKRQTKKTIKKTIKKKKKQGRQQND